MSKKTLSGFRFFGILFFGVGIVYLLYAFYALYSAYVVGSLSRFFYPWGGFPYLIVSILKLQLGIMFLKGIFKNFKPMLLIVGALDVLIGYFFMPCLDAGSVAESATSEI